MSDYYEIDFLKVEAKRSGDAIAVRYKISEQTYIHVVDGGFLQTGEELADHIREYYGNPYQIDHVVATHPDGDHAAGLRAILEQFEVANLWMLRPWLYAAEIIDRFTRFSSVENLQRRLKDIYPNICALEEMADEKGIPIWEPFQGAQIGVFTVLAPTKGRYLDLIVESEKTPQSEKIAKENALAAAGQRLYEAAAAVVALIKSAWGEEVFSPEGVSAENEVSVVQYARLCNHKILLTGDAGRDGLAEAADFSPLAGLILPGIDKFQIPHHGSRRNVSTELLDRWLGPRLDDKLPDGQSLFTAIISSAKEDEDHPRKAVVRAAIHRGARVIATEGQSIRTHRNAPDRGWAPVEPLAYPTEQED